jgi:hypothetical protein
MQLLPASIALVAFTFVCISASSEVDKDVVFVRQVSPNFLTGLWR